MQKTEEKIVGKLFHQGTEDSFCCSALILAQFHISNHSALTVYESVRCRFAVQSTGPEGIEKLEHAPVRSVLRNWTEPGPGPGPSSPAEGWKGGTLPSSSLSSSSSWSSSWSFVPSSCGSSRTEIHPKKRSQKRGFDSYYDTVNYSVHVDVPGSKIMVFTRSGHT